MDGVRKCTRGAERDESVHLPERTFEQRRQQVRWTIVVARPSQRRLSWLEGPNVPRSGDELPPTPCHASFGRRVATDTVLRPARADFLVTGS